MKLGVQPVFIVLQQWLNSRYKILLWQYQQWSRVLQFWRLYCEQYTIFRKCAYSLVFLRILEPDSWHLTLKWLKSCRCIQSWEPPPNIMFSSQYWCQHWGTLALCCVFWIINEENLNICCAAYSLFSDTKIITSYFANSTAHSTQPLHNNTAHTWNCYQLQTDINTTKCRGFYILHFLQCCSTVKVGSSTFAERDMWQCQKIKYYTQFKFCQTMKQSSIMLLSRSRPGLVMAALALAVLGGFHE